MSDTAPKPGSVRVRSDGTVSGSRIEVLTDAGTWQALRGVTRLRFTLGADEPRSLGSLDLVLWHLEADLPPEAVKYQQAPERDQ